MFVFLAKSPRKEPRQSNVIKKLGFSHFSEARISFIIRELMGPVQPPFVCNIHGQNIGSDTVPFFTTVISIVILRSLFHVISIVFLSCCPY